MKLNHSLLIQVIKKEEKVEHREPKTVQASKRQSVKDLANKIKDQVHEGPVPTRKKGCLDRAPDKRGY